MTKRVTTVFSGVPGAPWYSNFFFAQTDVAQECVNSTSRFWLAIAPLIVNEVSWTVQGDVATIDEATGEVTNVEAASGVNGAGSSVGELLPRQTQGLVRWQTALFASGRRLRGRTFLPGMTESNNLEGVPSSGTITAMANAGTALIAEPGTAFGIYSRTYRAFAVVTASTAWNQWATLRSRRD